MQPEFIKNTGNVWSNLRKGYSCHSQQILQPWELLTEHIMRTGTQPTSHAAICAAAFFGQGMVVMPTPQDLSVTWQSGGGSFSLHAKPYSPLPEERYLCYMLLRKCTRETILRMRLLVNETFSQKKLRPIPQFEMLYDLLNREIHTAKEENAVHECLEMCSIANSVAALCRLKICPVAP